MKKTLHLLTGGELGGIEVLVKEYALHSAHDNTFVFFRYGGVIAEEMKSLGLEVHVLGITNANLLYGFFYLVRLFVRHKYEVVITHHEDTFLHLVSLILKKLYPSTKLVTYRHSVIEPLEVAGLNLKNYRAMIKRWIQLKTFQQSDVVIAISNYVKKTIVDCLGIPGERIRVVYNGIPIQKFCAERHKINNRVRMIYVGRVEYIKGVQTIISALYSVKQMYDVELIVVGDGTYMPDLKRLVSEYDLENCVSFCGASLDVSKYLAQSDIFVHMPICEEGFGITVVEAMAAGCICVCAEKGGIPEIINDGVNGFLIHSGTSDELSDKLKMIIPDYIAGDCELIRETAIENSSKYNIQNYSAKIDTILDEKMT